jgi:hypothetical protein
VRLLKSEDSSYHVNLIKLSRGSNSNSARQLANNIQFTAYQTDSTLHLPYGFSLAHGDKFRNQQVLVEVSVPVGKRILVSSSVDDYHWFNIHPGRRHIHWDDGKDWNLELDEDIDDNDAYPFSTNVEYVMTSTGLSRTDHRNYNDEDRNSRKRHNKDRDDNDDDDQPEYKSKSKSNDTNGGGGYRYKTPTAPAAPAAPAKKDSVGVKRTAMVEVKLLSALSRV